ncbi:MAG: hypothetical protein PVSMB7_07700 [Chloroflexota bacterium]
MRARNMGLRFEQSEERDKGSDAEGYAGSHEIDPLSIKPELSPVFDHTGSYVLHVPAVEKGAIGS